MNDFEKGYTNEIIDKATVKTNNVSGLIIVTDDYITSNTSYIWPKIISLVFNDTAKNLV
jgi:hypothetical protein